MPGPGQLSSEPDADSFGARRTPPLITEAFGALGGAHDAFGREAKVPGAVRGLVFGGDLETVWQAMYLPNADHAQNR